LLLAALALLLLRQDVDVPTRELRGEPHILAAAADRQRQLALRHDHLDAVRILVEDNLRHLGRRQGVDDELRSVGPPLDDVDLLALQLVHDGLHTLATHADAGADGVDRAVLGDDGDLGARARITGHGLDLDDAVVDLRDLHGEQLRHELRPRARQKDLRPALLPAYIVYIGTHAVAVTDVLARDHFVAADDALGAAQVDDDIAVLDALGRTVDDLADAILVLVELALTLRLAHLLHDDLLGVLCGDAPEIERRQRLGNEIADLGFRIAPPGVLKRNLGGLVLDVLDNSQHA